MEALFERYTAAGWGGIVYLHGSQNTPSPTHTTHRERKRERETERMSEKATFYCRACKFFLTTQERDGWVLHLNTTMPTLNIWNIFP